MFNLLKTVLNFWKEKPHRWLTLLGLIVLILGIHFTPTIEEGVFGERHPASLSFQTDPIVDPYLHRIKRNSTLSEALRSEGLEGKHVFSLTEEAQKFKNLNQVQAGTGFRLVWSQKPVQEIVGIQFEFSPTEHLSLHRTGDNEWIAEKIDRPVKIELVTYSGIVQSSLWESALEAQMDPNLIAELTEIFAWQVDFNREVRSGDRWRLTVERKTVDQKQVGWGKIIAAEYDNEGEVFTAVAHTLSGHLKGYYAPDGTSLKRMFLKSPIRFGRISSRFRWKRFHPILRKNRPHLGVDYAAPRGTPIRAVGDGRLIFVGRNGGAGKMIKLRHNSIYSTAYKHLSRYASGLRRGKRIHQGDIIGYVGSTGLSTGPHLHFEFLVHGRFVDPMGRKFPAAAPVAKTNLSTFKEFSIMALQTLPQWFRPGVTPFGPGPVLASKIKQIDLTRRL